jgi:hypothetical protein
VIAAPTSGSALSVLGAGKFTTSASVPLTVETTSGNSGVIIKTSASTTNWLLGAQYNVGDTFEITPSTIAGGSVFSTPSLVVKSSGNIGIGNTGESASRLYVTGSDSTSSNYALTVRNSVGNELLQARNDGVIYLKGSVGVDTYTPAATLDVGGTSSMKVPVGTTAQRPGIAVAGMVRMNTTTGLPEWYDSTISFWRPFGANSFYSEVLVVAGGGGGGVDISGGGGAGGLITKSDGYALSLNVVYNITLGAGGANAANGSNSTAFGLVAIGGGRGGEYSVNNAGSGGSGGGGGGQSQPGGGSTSGQGNVGGSGTYGGGLSAGGGGGGAGAAGASAAYTSAGVGGNGGIGSSISITGTATYYAGGGGGGQRNFTTSATGGSGGGGAGGNSSNYQGQNGTANTGGGAGGHGAGGQTSSGGSGVIIVKCPNTFTAVFSAGITYSLSTSVLNHKVYTVTAGTGTVSFY